MQPDKQNKIEELLASGGDVRIVRDADGMNKYGCFSTPHPEILAYASSTASTISPAGYAAVEVLYDKIEKASATKSAQVIYAREMERVRQEIAELCNVKASIILGASGTDMHLFAAQLLNRPNLFIIMLEPAETGSGVPAALNGYDFSNRTANEAMAEADKVEIATILCRQPNGSLRAAAEVDAEVEALVIRAISRSQHVLLTVTDLTKTGLIVPSPASAMALKQRYPTMLDVLVDACQFRLANATIRAYLEQDFMVAMTGSKFVSGPAFSGALLVPPKIAEQLNNHILPPVLCLYSAVADWSVEWEARLGLIDRTNYGLLLRWEAALAEMRAFKLLAEKDIFEFTKQFAAAIEKRISNDPGFELLARREINRRPLTETTSWDS